MPVSKPMPIRSGRFRFSSATTAKPIIAGRAGAVYRIFNSGKKNFDVEFGGAGSVTVYPGFSFDFAPQSLVTISGADGEQVEGIYEVIGGGTTGRSGRFKFPTATTETTAEIISAGGKAIYRIFNSGDHLFQVSIPTGQPNVIDLPPEESLDVSLPVGQSITIDATSLPAGGVADGIYDVVDKLIEARNGRFKVPDATNANTRTIINLRNRIGATGFYRIYNSGQNTIGLFRGSSSTPDYELEENCSIDIYIGTGGNKTISVGGKNSTAVDIEGIYTFMDE